MLKNFSVNSPVSPEIQKLALEAMEKLVFDLEKKPCSILRDQIIRKVKEYHYANSPTPLMMLHADLNQAGFNDLAENTREGVYDEFEFYIRPENASQKAQKVARDRMCTVCHKTEKGMQLCGRCRIVYYCSTKCQKQDWPKHKPFCKPLD